ncbi:MAG: hypothetical protein ACRDKZ_08980, partial [Actinomycetota bacterium]
MELDNGTFQIVTLALLGVTLLVLLGVLASVSRLKKQVRATEPEGEAHALGAVEPHEGAVAEPSGETSPVQTSSVAEDGPVGTEPAVASAEEPQEQPFERDGRWLFRRGDELLMYDEQTGQWGPAPAGATLADAPEPVGTAPASSAGTSAAPVETAQPAGQTDEPGASQPATSD